MASVHQLFVHSVIRLSDSRVPVFLAFADCSCILTLNTFVWKQLLSLDDIMFSEWLSALLEHSSNLEFLLLLV